jgi:hypothetical protein
LEEKKQQLAAVESQAKEIVPKLVSLYQTNEEESEVEFFVGLKGLEILFREQLDTLKRGEYDYVIGGTQSIGEDAIVAFFRRIHIEREARGIRTRMLFNQNQRELIEKYYSVREFLLTQTRFIEHTAPVAINVYADKTLITTYGKSIYAIKITSREIAASFIAYFELLWKSAR